jgi:hypothetical protein
MTTRRPNNPADPEAAALDLIAQLPAHMFGTNAFASVLQDYRRRAARRVSNSC